MADDSEDPIDEELIQKNLELARQVGAKLNAFGIRRKKLVGRMMADLSDLVIGGEKLVRYLDAFLRSANADEATTALIDFDTELEHMGWHMTTARKDISWVCDTLDEDEDDED